VHDTVHEAGRTLGFAPTLAIHDDVTELDEDTLGHLLLVLREALSNIARHAHAHHAEVDLALCGSDVVLSVWDDGVGLPDHLVHGNGLGNMARRAQLLGGACQIDSQPGGGTTVAWRVPVVARCAHHG
jgi:signal transduction histidine kinase